MGIAINGKIANLADRTDEFVKHYRKCMIDLWEKVEGDMIEIIYTPIHSPTAMIGGKAVKQYASGVWVECKEDITLIIDKVPTRLNCQYFETTNENPNLTSKFLPKKKQLASSTIFHKNGNNEDFLFFLLFASPRCEVFEPIKKLQNYRPSAIKDFMVHDAVGIAIENEKLEKQKHLVYHTIYFVFDEDTLRAVAGTDYKIPMTSSVQPVFLREMLYRKITSDEKMMKEFNPDNFTNYGSSVKKVINEAEDLKVIDYNKGTLEWYLKDFDKNKTTILKLDKKNTSNPRLSLLDYLKDSESTIEVIKKHISAYKIKFNEVNATPLEETAN